MSRFVNLFSEIGKLNTVMLHRPGIEVEQLIPEYLERMLSEDTPHVPTAAKEHDYFADVIRKSGANVLYLRDLFLDVIKIEQAKHEFIEDYLIVGEAQSEYLKQAIREYLLSKTDEEFFECIMRGIRKKDIEVKPSSCLALVIQDDYPFFIDPVSSLYFTRDISICIGNGMIVSSMSMPFRKREPLLMRYIYKYHPFFRKDDTPLWYDYNLGYSVEGGDLLVLSDKVIAVGYSQRTSIGAIENIANNILRNGYEKILVFNLPKIRRFMHLDVLCTMIDHDKFIVSPHVAKGDFDMYEITLQKSGLLRASLVTKSMRDAFKRALGLRAIDFIQVGGDDYIDSTREHWNMGSNSLTVAPGEIITYSRNDITNSLLVKHGIKLHTIPDSELSRGRGGPRCMSMPINRDNLK